MHSSNKYVNNLSHFLFRRKLFLLKPNGKQLDVLSTKNNKFELETNEDEIFASTFAEVGQLFIWPHCSQRKPTMLSGDNNLQIWYVLFFEQPYCENLKTALKSQPFDRYFRHQSRLFCRKMVWTDLIYTWKRHCKSNYPLLKHLCFIFQRDLTYDEKPEHIKTLQEAPQHLQIVEWKRDGIRTQKNRYKEHLNILK